MKRFLTEIVVLLVVLGCASGVQAYSYSFDIQSGSLSLSIAQGFEHLTLTTPEALVIGYDSYPELDSTLAYDYSLAADLDVGYLVTIFTATQSGSASLDESLGLGISQGVDLTDWITAGGTADYDDSMTMSGVLGSAFISLFGLSAEVTPVDGGTLDLAATPVPVPAAVWLMASGLAGLAGLKRRRA